MRNFCLYSSSAKQNKKKPSLCDSTKGAFSYLQPDGVDWHVRATPVRGSVAYSFIITQWESNNTTDKPKSCFVCQEGESGNIRSK